MSGKYSLKEYEYDAEYKGNEILKNWKKVSDVPVGKGYFGEVKKF